MSTISISRSHSLGLDGARRAADDVAERLRREYGLTTRRDGDTVWVEGRGIKGRLDATPDQVHVQAQLGFAARPFRRVLHREIETELDRLTS